MGRKPNPKPEERTELAIAADKQVARLEEIDNTYGEGAVYQRERVEDEIKFYIQQSGMAMLEAGKRLIVLKEHEPHGNFLKSLEIIGINPETARQMMNASVKFLERANSKSIWNLPITKLYDLALLDNDKIDELEEGGTVAGLTLDEIQRMTTREVREALRKERDLRKAEAELQERLLLQKEQKINDLERELHLRPKPTQEMMNEARLKQLAMTFISRCVELQTAMRQMRELLDEAARLPEVENVRLAAFAEELVTYGTEGVIADWEVLTDEVVNLRPKEELPHVPRLG